MAHGGKRQGAGRKKGFAATSAEEARRVLAQRVSEEITPLCDVLIGKAKKGDVRALHELFDRAWGRPPQGILVTQAQAPVEAAPNIDMRQLALLYEDLLKVQITKDISFEQAAASFRQWTVSASF